MWLKVTNKTLTDDELKDQIVKTEALIEQWLELKKYVEAYIWLVVVPRFCAYRGKQYLQFLLDFGQGFIFETDKRIEKWSTVVEKTKDLEDPNLSYGEAAKE